MSDIDLTPVLKRKMANYPRKRGRYNSSELYGITHGYVTPQSWLNAPEKDVVSMLRMWNGILVHDHVQRLLTEGGQNEVKKEHFHNGITLVAKVDHLPRGLDEVWEIKSSEEAMDASKPSHDYQGKLYCSIFKLPVAKVFQPVQNADGLWLKLIGTVERDDVWFERELEKLFDFHLKVEKLWENKNEVLEITSQMPFQQQQ